MITETRTSRITLWLHPLHPCIHVNTRRYISTHLDQHRRRSPTFRTCAFLSRVALGAFNSSVLSGPTGGAREMGGFLLTCFFFFFGGEDHELIPSLFLLLPIATTCVRPVNISSFFFFRSLLDVRLSSFSLFFLFFSFLLLLLQSNSTMTA